MARSHDAHAEPHDRPEQRRAIGERRIMPLGAIAAHLRCGLDRQPGA
jgi:hypothetical protein